MRVVSFPFPITISATLIVSLIICIGCRSSHINHSNLKGINLIVNYPIVIANEQVKISNLRDTISIIYFNDYVLYQLPGTREFETDKKIPGTETYFICRKKASNGFLFNSINDNNKGMNFPVDSFLKNRAFAGVNFDINSNDTLIEVSKEGEFSFLEKYISKTNTETYPDSIYYYFINKFKNIDYSLSPKLDSIKGKKLYKVRLIYNNKFSSSEKVMLPKREILFEIQEKTILNSKEIIDFIERFKKMN
jgi:hypothetical protein